MKKKFPLPMWVIFMSTCCGSSIAFWLKYAKNGMEGMVGVALILATCFAIMFLVHYLSKRVKSKG